MDRPLDPIFRKKRLIKNSVKVSIGLLGLVLFFLWLPRLLESSVSRNRIRTAVVEVGPVDATITGSGTVIPEFEQVLTSPIETKVMKILESPGVRLKSGQRILELDLNEQLNSIKNYDDQIALKINEQNKLKLDNKNRTNDLQSQIEIKKLNLDVLKSKTIQQEKLFQIGAASRSLVEIAKMEENIAKIELKKLENSLLLDEETHRNQIESLDTEVKVLKDKKDELMRQLKLAEVRSEGEGVLTWVVPEQGTSIRKGDMIARIADLTSFKVKATFSDIHVSNISTGLPVIIKMEDYELQGTVASILPTIENGILTCYITLTDKSNERLRSNLRVDVYIVIDRKEKALRVKKGPFANGAGLQDVFIIKENVGLKRKVRLGISNFDYCEVIEGLEKGEEIIISDMTEYMHLNKIKIN